MMRPVAAALLCIGWLGSCAWAEEPVLSGTDPKSLIATERNEGNVTLQGSHLCRPDTTGYTFDKDVQVFARASRGEGAWRPVPISGWNSSQISVRLPNDPYMKSRDQVEFKVVVRDMGESLPLALMVQGYPTQAPSITWITQYVRKVTGEKTTATINLTGKNFAPDAYFVDEAGKNVPIGRLIAGEGEAVVWIDAGSPGVHSVKVVTKAGSSAAAQFTVVDAPRVTAAEPAKIQLTDPIPADIPVRLALDAQVKPEIAVRANDTASWATAKVTDVSGNSAVMHLAPADLRPGQAVQVKLTNAGGESTTAIPVERVMKVRTDVHLPTVDRMAPKVGADAAPRVK
jgi:hypothetical protein